MAELNLGYTEIRSPVDGKTGVMLIQPGNMITANSAAPLVTISQIQPIKISFSLPQSDLQLILARQRSKGLIATVDTDDLTGKPLSAPVDFTSNAVNDKSGTVELRATFDNRRFSFLPGQLVNVTVELDSIPNAVVVPRDAVNDGPEGAYVYVVVNGKTEQHDVKVLFDDFEICGGRRRREAGRSGNRRGTVAGPARCRSERSSIAGRCARRAAASRDTGRRARSIMNISRLFIERPVMTTLLMAALVIFGLFGYATLPVSELPNIDFPTISVQCRTAGRRP